MRTEKAPPPKDRIRQLILEHGFDRVGFAPAGPTPGADAFRQWLQLGYAGSMHYLRRSLERREDPREILAGARTVICVALEYPSPARRDLETAPEGLARISTYAQGADYHRVMSRRLRALSGRLAASTGESFRWYVDTGPVLEKAWAERAGLGWIGKNTCVIDPARGSFFFIGVILSTLEVPADIPAADHCGRCRRCIEACPTQAIVEPYVLDARRCISYLTIEERGPIPRHLAVGSGDWVFGCDVCQEVCPYNQREPQGGDPDLAPRPENRSPELRELAQLTEPQFRIRFRGTPVLRSRFDGFLRNVAIAAGNARGSGGRPILESLRRRPDLMRHPATARAILETLGGAGSGQDDGDPGSPPVDDRGPTSSPIS